MAKTSLVPAARIERLILVIGNQRVMLDLDLAELYGVENRALLQAVRRNLQRFPADFMFELTQEEFDELKSQAVVADTGHGGRRYPPFAFTEHGVAMLSSVLNSDRAVAANIEIMRAFVRLRELIASHDDLVRKLAGLERKYDGQFQMIFEAIREIMSPPEPPMRRIGLRRGDSEVSSR